MRAVRLAIGVALLGSAILADDARASDTFDPTPFLSKRGVRWLAVEVYADECKPCRAQVPAWNQLRDRYDSEGLQMLTIVRPSGGHCGRPPHPVDEVVCDDTGAAARSLGLSETQTGAFLWSWRGSLLARGADPGAFKDAIERDRARATRVAVDTRLGGEGPLPSRALHEALRAALKRQGKLSLVSPATESARLDRLGLSRFDRVYGVKKRCASSVHGDALLGARTLGGKEPQLELVLRSESECLLARAKVPADPRALQATAERGIEALHAALMSTIERPAPYSQTSPDDRAFEAKVAARYAPPTVQDDGDRQRSAQLRKVVAGWLGTRFELGGQGRQGIDAFAFARTVYQEAFGLDIGATAEEQLERHLRVAVSASLEDSLLPGDLFFYVSYGYLPRHVAVYLGNGELAQSVVVRGVVVDPLPKEVPEYLWVVVHRPLAQR